MKQRSICSNAIADRTAHLAYLETTGFFGRLLSYSWASPFIPFGIFLPLGIIGTGNVVPLVADFMNPRFRHVDAALIGLGLLTVNRLHPA